MPKKGCTQLREAAVRATRHLDSTMGFHVKRINGVATRHVEAIVLGSAEE